MTTGTTLRVQHTQSGGVYLDSPFIELHTCTVKYPAITPVLVWVLDEDAYRTYDRYKFQIHANNI
jgi:hypothetical protein